MNPKQIYFDNAATSFPKAPGVAQAVYTYLTDVGSNINRGIYKQAIEAENVVFETRELLCDFFNSPKPENIVFTKNITESLNILLKGLLKPGDHILTSSMEHNAVIRPLNHLKAKYDGSLEIGILPCNKYGALPQGNALEKLLEKHLLPHTKALVIAHASNVCGTIMPLKELGRFCRKHHLFFLIDTAQTAGIEHIDFSEIHADGLAFTGHKGLLGPQGIGGMVLSDRILPQLEPLITGGTGSSSEEEFQPSFMPDRFEAGTLNIPGIYGLNASLKYIKKVTIDCIKGTESQLTQSFLKEILHVKNVVLIGKSDMTDRTAVASLDFPGMDNALISHRLSSVHGIINRCGLHCAPLAHKTLGTYPQGTVRLSFSHFNTITEVNSSLEAIQECLTYLK